VVLERLFAQQTRPRFRASDVNIIVLASTVPIGHTKISLIQAVIALKCIIVLFGVEK
jgi:hypothetical protein